MASMLRANLFRLRRTPKTWFCVAGYVFVVGVLAVALATSAHELASGRTTLTTQLNVAEAYGCAGMLAPLICSIMLGSFFVSDVRNRTICNVLQTHGGRAAYAGAALATVAVAAVLVVALGVLSMEVALRAGGVTLVGYDAAALAAWAVCAVLLACAYALAVVLVALATASAGATAAAMCLLPTGILEVLIVTVLKNVLAGVTLADVAGAASLLGGVAEMALVAQLVTLMQGVVPSAASAAAALGAIAALSALIAWTLRRKELG